MYPSHQGQPEHAFFLLPPPEASALSCLCRQGPSKARFSGSFLWLLWLYSQPSLHVSQGSDSLPTLGTGTPKGLPLISRAAHQISSTTSAIALNGPFSLACPPLTGLGRPRPALGRALLLWIVHHNSNSTQTGHSSSPVRPPTPPAPTDHGSLQHAG